ncbi:MAG: hypothetical protein ACJ8LG_21675 [Massilia sp.]
MVNLGKIIPAPEAVLREGLVVLGGVLIAAYIISRFPAAQRFVAANSVTVKSPDGSVLW